MRGKTYRVYLTEEEKKRLEDMVSKGVHPARQIRRGRILLLLLNETEDKQGKVARVAEQSERARQCPCNTVLVYNVSKPYAEEGVERVLNRKKRETPPVQAKITGEIEAKIGGDPESMMSSLNEAIIDIKERHLKSLPVVT
jgi:hypothetical protein